MNRYGLALVSAALLLAACGGKQTMASKSAAAYREAQAKGIAVTGGHEHGHETGAAATSSMDEMDHSTMDHSAMDHTSMDHTSMDHTSMDHASMDHSTMNHAAMDHSTMDHSAMDHSAHAAMQHDMTQHGAPASNAEIAPVPTTPHAILQPDAFDAPAASAVAEAQKAAGVKKEE